ncbi:hypothetical protein KPA97_67060 [Burkholderia cenocepacia]|nr:hypothetical protein [Burkholderia cenocepacia]MDR5670954.1 hypothetical protein [Burkholderia cenocepacia]
MQTKPELELADAERMLAAARAEAERHGWAVSIEQDAQIARAGTQSVAE